jgi:hypothetical protein
VPDIRKSRAAATGSQPMICTAKTSSISNSIPPIAKCAQAVGSALKPKQEPACSQSIQIKHNIRPCRKRVSAKKHLISSRNMPNERVSREPSLKRVRGFDLRHARYCGLSKTRLQHLFVAASLNLVRMGTWLMEQPHAQTRRSRFKKLMGSEPVQIAA